MQEPKRTNLVVLVVVILVASLLVNWFLIQFIDLGVITSQPVPVHNLLGLVGVIVSAGVLYLLLANAGFGKVTRDSGRRLVAGPLSTFLTGDALGFYLIVLIGVLAVSMLLRCLNIALLP